MGGLIDQRQDQEDQRSLAKLEKQQGRKLPYLVQATMTQVKAVNRLTQRPWKQLPLADFTKAFAAYDALMKELLVYRDAHGDEARAMHLENYIQQQENMQRFARDFMHRLEDNKPFSKNELLMAESAPRQIMNEYNHLVAIYNNLR